MKRAVLTLFASAGMASAAAAAEVAVTSNITTATTWTASNTYNLKGQIYVTNGATLTIEAGTTIASTPGATPQDNGSLAVTRGSQIFVNGTPGNPVIMTSTEDVKTWAGSIVTPTGPGGDDEVISQGDRTTGIWRPTANEWGNLTVMGSAYISEDLIGTNSATCGNNVADMEGLNTGPAFDRYGGTDDDDDSGVIHYLSTRYTGLVLDVGVELNGISLGGIGRGTDIEGIDIMNNIDDGIEIWGGTVGLKYVNVWNIGDDSFDIDQGWRGKAQFGLIVQGYSDPVKQGSGIGDNCIEHDGAEDSDYQPVTTAVMYNFTIVGQPGGSCSGGAVTSGGDAGTAWRDNARVQHRNHIFVDMGDEIVKFDNDDGDGANGYGHNGTLDWLATWSTPYTATSTVNPCANPAMTYTAQVNGFLAEVRGCVIQSSASLGDAPLDISLPFFDNTITGGAVLTKIVREDEQALGSPLLCMARVTALDPMPAGAAATKVPVMQAPHLTDSFYCEAPYAGAFEPGGTNWALGWTAADAYCLFDEPAPTVAFRNGGTNPASYSASKVILGDTFTASVDNTLAGEFTSVLFAFDTPFSVTLSGGQTLLAIDFGGQGELFSGAGLGPASPGPTDQYSLPIPAQGAFCGLALYSQALQFGSPPFTLSNAQDLVVGNN